VEQIAAPGRTHPRPDLATPYVAPATEEELAVAGIWQRILGVDRVGLDDDFFALGGHSLAAVQIGAKIRSRFGVELELREFFDRPTVAGTVASLAEGGREEPEDGIQALTRDDPGDDLDLDLDGLSDEEVEARLQELLAEETKGQGDPA
jgi:phthiocerol/phenolphthiocerol synthesis type-I polyketide synthase E